MAGYSRYAILRQHPSSGPDETVDLMLSFTDASGPTRIVEDWRPDYTRRLDVNRRMRGRHRGFRHTARLQFEILTMDDQSVLAQIATRSASVDWEMYLSLDGGVTEEQVELTGYDGPNDIGGKKFAGATFSATFEAVELVDEIPDLTGSVVPISTPTLVALYTSLPTADSSWNRRLIYYQPTPSERAELLVCADAGGGNFEWRAWA